MNHRVLPVILSACLGAGLFAADAQAGRRLRVWFWEDPFQGPGFVFVPGPVRHFFGQDDESPDEFDSGDGSDFDESYYDPALEAPAVKPKPVGKKAAATGATAPAKLKDATLAKAAASAPGDEADVLASGALSCEKAGSIVSGYGFSSVKPADCKGQVYAFSASRDGKAFAIKLNAVSGELTEVRKVK